VRTRGRDRYLKWAFAVALLLHALALAAAGRLPAAPAGDGGLDQLRVFDDSAPIVISAVSLVEWSESPRQASPAEPPAPRIIRSAVTPQVAAPSTTRSGETVAQQPQKAILPAHPGSRRPAISRHPQAAGPGGGGGGGAVDLGSRSARGDWGGAPSGSTPVGTPPGAGEGSGKGAGAGSGGGTGGGTGGGEGSGRGGGSGAGSGEGDSGVGTSTPFTSKIADRSEPEVIAKGALDYPQAAAEEGVEGTVQLEVLVTESGAVAEVKVTKSSGDQRLDAAAKEWVRRWRYRPAMQDGKARQVPTHATVIFELR